MQLNKLYEGHKNLYKWEDIEAFLEENEDLLESENWKELIKKAKEYENLYNFILYYIGKVADAEPFPNTYYSVGYGHRSVVCIDHQTGKQGWHFRYRDMGGLFHTQAIFVSLKQAVEYIDQEIKHNPRMIPEHFSISRMNPKTVDNNGCITIDAKQYDKMVPVLVRRAGVIYELGTEIKQDLNLGRISKIMNDFFKSHPDIYFDLDGSEIGADFKYDVHDWKSCQPTNDPNIQIFELQYKRTCRISSDNLTWVPISVGLKLKSSFQKKKDLFTMLKLADPDILTEIKYIQQSFNFDDFRLELICDYIRTLQASPLSPMGSYTEMWFDFKIIFTKEISLQKYL